MDMTHERIALLDEDYALVSRRLIDECQSALQHSDDPRDRKLGAELKVALDSTIAAVAKAQRSDYLTLKQKFARNGIRYRLPDGLDV